MREEFNKIIRDPNLKPICTDFLIDSVENLTGATGLSSLTKIYNSISDRIFLTKAFKVINEISEINWKKRAQFIMKMDDNTSSGTEKLLLAINEFQTIEKCVYFGRLCKIRAREEIGLDEFYRMTKLIQDAYIPDLAQLQQLSDKNRVSMNVLLGKSNNHKQESAENFAPLITLGLVYGFDRDNPRNLLGGNKGIASVSTLYELTYIGKVVLTHYQEIFAQNNTTKKT